MEVNILIEGYPIPTEFVVIDTTNAPSACPKVILGRPFLKTAKVNIDFDEMRSVVRLPNVCLWFSRDGMLTSRYAHNRAWKLEVEEQIAKGGFRSRGGYGGRGRGRGN